MSRTSLQKAVDLLDGQVATANAIGVRQAHVWRWLNTTRNGVPGEYVIPICAATHYQITPHELRPDLYPYLEDGLPENMRSRKVAA